jgi:hypothetical protein
VVLEEVPITHQTLSLVEAVAVAASTVVAVEELTQKLTGSTVVVAVEDLASPTQLDSNRLSTQRPGSQPMEQQVLHTTWVQR